MLPLVQMHQLVHPSNFDALPSHLARHHMSHTLNSHFFDGPKDAQNAVKHSSGFQFQRPLPIRTLHPARPDHGRPCVSTGLPPHAFDTNEHQLRRKTPSGTIDAGYDGSPAQFASGPPALKHMILSTSSEVVSSRGRRLGSGLLAADYQDGAGVTLPHDISGFRPPGNHDLVSGPGFSRDRLAPTDLYSPYFPLQPVPLHDGGLKPAQDLRPDRLGMQRNSYAGLGKYPTSSHLEPRRLDSLAHFLPNAQGSPRHFESTPSSYFSLAYPPVAPQRIGFPNSMPYFAPPPVTFGPEHSQVTPQFGSSVSLGPYLNFDSLSLEGAGGSTEPSTCLDFREKIIASAHQAYIDLLAYHHQTRKFQQPNSSCGVGARSQVFPKPPRRISKATGCHAPIQGQLRHRRPSNARPQYLAHPGLSVPLRNIGSAPSEGSQGWPITSNSISTVPRSLLAVGDHSFPVSSAKASLDMLTHLCEQGEWQWLEGIMLGGCLQFGLDQFELALEWFTRASVLNASDVDTLSNIAATLYCLNRHEEAEKTWLKAIHMCPSALEAVEHLVGLLYKKRSPEAVRIIEFVQNSLRISRQVSYLAVPNTTPSSSAASHDVYSPGYGSSGYAVPGSENGRVLALIHAKGTMQYTLKDIEQASRSFEEAVLVSTGRRINSIQELVHRIQYVLSAADSHELDAAYIADPARPLLLPPEKARLTARLVFPQDGELHGLRYVPMGAAKRAAIQTTSNSLLSLAKILQDAVSSGTFVPTLLRRPSGIADILSLYYLSLSLQESPSTANNVGILLASIQQEATTAGSSSRHPIQQPSVPGVPPGSGLALALSYYNYGLALDPKHVHLHTNLGSLLKDIGQLDLAIQMYEKAVACDGNFDIALTNLANAVKDRGRVSDAIAYYKRAVISNPEFAEAVCGLSTALNSVCDWRGRGGVILNSGQYDRWHVDDQGMLVDACVRGVGSGLARRVVEIVQKQLEDAASWGAGALQQDIIASLASHARRRASRDNRDDLDWETRLRSWSQGRWEGSRILRFTERSARTAMWQWYCDKYLSGLETSASSYLRVPLPQSLTTPSAPTVLPFHTFTCPLTAKDIRMISQRNASRISCSTLRSPWLPRAVYPPPPPPSPQLRIGYVSSDFNNHPLAHLMQSVFGLHDRVKIRAVCYATTASDKSVHRLQIEREAPIFRDVSSWSSDRLVQQIVEDGIHILVNLNGYTRGARNEVFAARPAPIQMSFMGFAGTLGAEWCDYILADTTAIPPETLRPWRGNAHVEDVFDDDMEDTDGEWIYSENVIFCRDTFFCCDHAQSSDPGEHRVSWEEEQRRRWKMRKELFPSLSDDVILLGNFNQLYKIDPGTFRTWLRILSHVPKAVLWLLRFPELGEANLRRTARAWAGTEVASRIMFTDVAPKNQHIARARVCDLFLDTPECNAHTTAADVLWSSTPLLTFPRYPYKMCSRMAASILKGALPKNAHGERAAEELVASSDEDYEELAIRLASGLTYNITQDYGEGVGRLAELRRLLWENKWTCALFDTRRWVSDLERAYQEAWRRWVAGEHGDIYL